MSILKLSESEKEFYPGLVKLGGCHKMTHYFAMSTFVVLQGRWCWAIRPTMDIEIRLPLILNPILPNQQSSVYWSYQNKHFFFVTNWSGIYIFLLHASRHD